MKEQFTISSRDGSTRAVTTLDVDANQTDASPLSTKRRPEKSNLLQRMWRRKWVYALILPGVVYFLIFYYLPLLGNVVAFQNYSPYLGFFRSPWTGLDNFNAVFS